MILKILIGLGIVLFALFMITFIVYFFNLDMKIVAKIMPVIEKHYDTIKREKRI